MADAHEKSMLYDGVPRENEYVMAMAPSGSLVEWRLYQGGKPIASGIARDNMENALRDAGLLVRDGRPSGPVAHAS